MFNIQRQLEILLEANQKINATLEIPTIMQALVSSSITLVDAKAGTAGLFTDNKIVFAEYNDRGNLREINYEFEKGDGVAGRIIETKEPYFTNEAFKDSQVIPEMQQKLSIYNVISVPLLSKSGELLGCVEIHNANENREFDEVDVELLDGLCSSAATALENAQLLFQYKQIQEDLLKKEEELNEKIKDLENFYDLSVNRELKIKELNEEIASLKEKLSQAGQ
jgi:GAF domain-containing protein